MSSIDWSSHIKKIVKLVSSIIQNSSHLTKETGKVNIKGDHTIEMDEKIEKAVISYIRKSKLPASIFSEEIGFIQNHPNPSHLLVFDPLDGSTNYQIGKNLLPYGFMIACYKLSKTVRLNSIVSSSAIEHTTQNMWIFDGMLTKTLNNESVLISNNCEISNKTTTYFDIYYKKAYESFSQLPEKVHVRWSGSNIGSLLYTLLGISAVMGAKLMRPEEIGTVYSLIKGAGGKVVDHSGNDLGEKKFDIHSTYEIIGGSPAVVEFIQKTVHV